MSTNAPIQADTHRLYIDESSMLTTIDYRRLLDSSYGAGRWALQRIDIAMPSEPTGAIRYRGALVVDGAPVCYATGEYQYTGDQGRICYATGIDLAKTDCLRLLCERMELIAVSAALRDYNDDHEASSVRGIAYGLGFTGLAIGAGALVVLLLNVIVEGLS